MFNDIYFVEANIIPLSSDEVSRKRATKASTSITYELIYQNNADVTDRYIESIINTKYVSQK